MRRAVGYPDASDTARRAGHGGARLLGCPGIALLLAACICVLGTGCRDAATTWSSRARSPDGRWIAVARSQQWGGPGTAYDATTVYLKRGSTGRGALAGFLAGHPNPIEVLEFSHQYATMSLKMRWVTPTHLEVAYGPSGRPDDYVSLDFQAVRCADVKISVLNSAGAPADPRTGRGTTRSAGPG
jgi:hypothetical protein